MQNLNGFKRLAFLFLQSVFVSDRSFVHSVCCPSVLAAGSWAPAMVLLRNMLSSDVQDRQLSFFQLESYGPGSNATGLTFR